MTTYTTNEILIQEEMNEVDCECMRSTFKPKNLFVMPGGGASAILYSLGIFKALNSAGLLIVDGLFNKDNVFIASSGSTLTSFLVLTCIHLNLHKQENWFETYVEASVSKMSPLVIADAFVSSQFYSLFAEKLANCFVGHSLFDHINGIFNFLLPEAFKGKPGFDFLNDDLANYFKFNYIKIVNNIPHMSDNQKDLARLTVAEQFKSMFCSCCTTNGLSYSRFFSNHDAAAVTDNFINCVSSYLDNKYIRNVLFYALVTYDEHAYSKLVVRNTFNLMGRNAIETNYFMINFFKSECIKKVKNCVLISPPNKFNPVCKFSVPLYTDLQQSIYYESDFAHYSERFLGNYFFHENNDMRKLVSLFGYYETIHTLKKINTFNSGKRDIIAFDKLLKYYYYFDVYTQKYKLIKKIGDNFYLKDEKVVGSFTSLLKFDGNFYSFFDDIEKDADALLVDCYGADATKNAQTSYSNKIKFSLFVDFMQSPGNVDLTLFELYPVQTGSTTNCVDKKIWKHPEKYLNKEYKRVSKNAVSVYWP